MNSVVSFVRSLSLVKNHAHWSPAVSKLVDELRSSSTTSSQRSSILSSLEPYVIRPSFTNTKDDERLNAKGDLLRLWEFMLSYVEVASEPHQRKRAFALIIAIIEREEFSLASLGFKNSLTPSQHAKPQLRLAQKYNALLIQTLLFVVKSVNNKTRLSESLQFQAQTLAVFFFRLPLVGGRVVEALQHSIDVQSTNAALQTGQDTSEHDVDISASPEPAKIPEDIGNVAFGNSTNVKKDSVFIKHNPDLFQWSYFHSGPETALLQEYVTQDGYPDINWFTEKVPFFLLFTEMFALHVDKFGTKPIEWNVIPAYDLILKCFLPHLQSGLWWHSIIRRQYDSGVGWVTSAPAYARVMATAKALLKTNPALLSPFVTICFQCTNIHSLWSIDACVEQLGLWFSSVAESTFLVKNVRTLPEEFDFDGYWYGLSHLLDSELFQVSLKVCSLLFNTLDTFHGQFRVELITNLMTHSFFKLFLHWCPEVRTYFQLLIVYKILRSDRRGLPCFTDSKVLQQFNGVVKKSRLPFVPSVNEDLSNERRMAVFDSSNSDDNEQLLIDIMLCSKIDAYVRMCLDDDPAIPVNCRPYVKSALKSYSSLLSKYYSWSYPKTSYESLASLASKVVENPAVSYASRIR